MIKYIFLCLFLVGCKSGVDHSPQLPKQSIKQCVDLVHGYICKVSVLIDEGKTPLSELDICYYNPTDGGYGIINIKCSDYEKIKKQAMDD